MKKTLSTLLVIVMMLACTTSAFAVSSPANNVEAAAIMESDILGTRADEDGVLLEDRATTSGLPFTMTARSVSNLLTTYSSSGKNFTGDYFDFFEGTGLLIEGTVTHTLGEGTSPKVGACYYMVESDTFVAACWDFFPSGEEWSHWSPKATSLTNIVLYDNETYYGFIKNQEGRGTVSGTLTFSVSTDPFN